MHVILSWACLFRKSEQKISKNHKILKNFQPVLFSFLDFDEQKTLLLNPSDFDELGGISVAFGLFFVFFTTISKQRELIRLLKQMISRMMQYLISFVFLSLFRSFLGPNMELILDCFVLGCLHEFENLIINPRDIVFNNSGKAQNITFCLSH